MKIIPFENTEKFKKEAAKLLRDDFPCYSDCAYQEVESCLEEGKIALMALHDGGLTGFIGAAPQYGITGWELHPLIVRRDCRGKGLGAALVRALEREAAARGGVTIYLGTDDEHGQTTLSNTDLYDDLHGRIGNIKNLRHHPYEFYQKQGYKIVGVIPDANGLGRPDIIMAKRISPSG